MNIRLGGWSRILAPGYSWCERCKTPWPFVHPHMTKYDDRRFAGRCCFPLCEKCWHDLGTPERRLPYYERFAAWSSPERRPQIRDAVAAGR